MKGRTNEEGIDPATDKPTDNARVRGELESRGGGKHGAPQERTMIEEILEPENLAAAWKRVKANKGAPGIDGMTVGDFPAFARGHWPRIATAIREGNIRPAPVKRVWIPKPDGSQRPLGIPSLARLRLRPQKPETRNQRPDRKLDLTTKYSLFQDSRACPQPATAASASGRSAGVPPG